jgi:hypothetical protein
MTAREFIEKIRQVVYNTTVTGCLSLLQEPPGRKPSPQLAALSQWFNQLSEADRAKVRGVIELAARKSVFGVFAVLDGVRQVENTESKGALELRYWKDGQSQLLNDPNAEPLHDIFNQIVPPA